MRYDANTLAQHGLGQTKAEADVIDFPSHYNRNGKETIDFIEHIVSGYKDPVAAGLVWQSLKYLDRAPHKGDALKDLKKAQRYLGRLIAKMEGRDGWE